MTQSLWFFGARLNIIADHTTTGGQYDLIEGYFPPGSQTPPHRHTDRPELYPLLNSISNPLILFHEIFDINHFCFSPCFHCFSCLPSVSLLK
jgi:hypothetical protein